MLQKPLSKGSWSLEQSHRSNSVFWTWDPGRLSAVLFMLKHAGDRIWSNLKAAKYQMVTWAYIWKFPSSPSTKFHLIIKKRIGHIHIYKCRIICLLCPPSGIWASKERQNPLWNEKAWLHHFCWESISLFGRRWGGWLDVTFSSLMDLQHHNFPLQDLSWTNNLTYFFADTALHLLYFLPCDMALDVHKIGPVVWDPWTLGI